MKFEDLQDITFITKTLNQQLAEAQAVVEEDLSRKLSRADPVLLLLKSYFAVHYQLVEIINDLARQNLLTYARGDVLDHIGTFAGVDRLQSAYAKTTAKVTLTTSRSRTTFISAGTRFHAGDNNYFALDSAAVFMAGDTETTVTATCLNAGIAGNDYAIGELNQIVDPQPYLQSIVNITESAGGADIESDDDYRERIRIAPEFYSVAGSYGAYDYWTRSFSTLIEDIFIQSENPGEVDIYPLLANGEIPNAQFLADLQAFLSADKIRPLTDNIICKSPNVVNYDIELEYWIADSDSINQASIIEAVESAVDEFVLWQKSVLGRDVNPTELYRKLRNAGVKRANIIQPAFNVIAQDAVAVADSIILSYRGLELD